MKDSNTISVLFIKNNLRFANRCLRLSKSSLDEKA